MTESVVQKAAEWEAWYGFDKFGVAAWLRGEPLTDNAAPEVSAS